MPENEFLTLKEAAKWATQYTGRWVSLHNISYLINYARIHTYDQQGKLRDTFNGATRVSLDELREYYASSSREKKWKKVLGDHINWNLSFEKVTEAETTKHVHRLHQYKGKFIPQLVKYFLDEHVNDDKEQIFFRKGDIILDPFVGSGTTLVECLELGLHSIGIDISAFNCMISEVKTRKYDLDQTTKILRAAAKATYDFRASKLHDKTENKLDQWISSINKAYYPNPHFKFMLRRLRGFRDIISNETKSMNNDDKNRLRNTEKALIKHMEEREVIETEVNDFLRCVGMPFPFQITASNILYIDNEFSAIYSKKVLKCLSNRTSKQKQTKLVVDNSNLPDKLTFLYRWFTEKQRQEMQYYLTQIPKEDDPRIGNLMRIILSRTIRSCRATTHYDLATLLKPQSEPYYCPKHYKICKPVTSIVAHLRRYTEDTIDRLKKFDKLRQNVFCEIINGDSRTLDIFGYLKEKNPDFYKIAEVKKIDGIFTSPPYVGQIDYHEQHAYAYELFGIDRKDDLEIGPKLKGTSKVAQADYINGISEVLINMKRFMKDDASIFIVANDSRNLYKNIAKRAGLRIVKTFYRPVLNRTERDKQPYAESIFHMKFT